MTLHFQPASDQLNLITPTMADFLQKHKLLTKVQVAEIDPQYADGIKFSKKYNIDLANELNCLIFQGERNGKPKYAAAVVQSGKRVNSGAVLKHAMDASKISFANLSEVLQQTKMELGSITPVGLPDNYQILIDQDVQHLNTVIVGSGKKNSKMLLNVDVLLGLPNVKLIANLAKA